MKIKKRLQMLIAVMAMLSMICGSLPAAHADSPTGEEEVALPGPFQASAEYTYSAPNASPFTQNWAWQYYDAAAGSYKNLTTVSGVGKIDVSSSYPIGENDDDTGDTFIRVNDGNVARIGKYWMAPDFYAKSGDKAPNNYYAVRTFIVPESGNVTITAENGVPEYSGSIRGATNRTTKNTAVRLIKTDVNNTYKTQIWPTVNDSNLVTTIDGYDGTFALVQGQASTEFPPLTVNVKKGERLRFEVGTKSTSPWVNVGVYWDPKITYNSLSYELPTYQASEAYAIRTGAYYADPWTWDYYDAKEEDYKLLTAKTDSNYFAHTNAWGQVVRMNGTTMYGDGRSDGNGGFTADETYTKACQRYYPVRSFTAPQTGNVAITANGPVYSSGTAQSPHLRIMLQHGTEFTKVWPVEEDDYVINQTTALDPFPTVFRNIQQGDILHFEMITTGDNQHTDWDPVVSYISFKEVESLLSGINNLPIDQEFALTFKEPLTADVTAEDIAITGGSATVKSVEMGNSSKTVKFAFNGLEFCKSYTATIKDPTDEAGLEILYRFTFTTMEGPATYQASEAFVAAAGQNHPDPWRWEYYDTGSSTGEDTGGDPSSKYKLLEGGTYAEAFSSSSSFPAPETDDSGGFGFKRDGYDNASTTVGKYWMTPDKNAGEKRKQYYAVRTFTAPETGNITITAAGITNADAGKILGQVKGTANGANLRLMLQKGETNTQIWPAEGWQNVKRSGYVIFSPLTIDIREGEKLHFEVADSTASGSTNWDQAAYWDPVITYNAGIVVDTPNITFNNGANLTGFNDIVNSSTDVTVTVPATACYMSTDSVVPIVAVYDAGGAPVSVAVGEPQGLSMSVPKDLTVTLSPIAGETPQNGYIKVFLWDSVDSELKLMPLGIIGTKPVLGTALVEAEAKAVYVGTGEPGQEVALLAKDNNGDILYVEQGAVDANGIFRIPLPAGLENNTIRCNLSGELIEANCLYTSNTGESTGVGTMSSPLSFQKALELAKDGERIIVMDEIVLPTDFEWPEEEKHVIVSGGGDGAALNLYRLESLVLNINTDATFENLELASTQNGDADKKGTIRACGNVVTLEESVSTRGIFSAFYGGARNWDTVDKTETYVYGGNFNRIYGGGGHVLGDCKLTVGGNTNTTAGVDPSIEKNGIFEPYIYGGTLDNVVDGDCITTITGNTAAQYLYGGSQDIKENADRGSGVKGKTVVNLNGGKFMNVYGMNPPSPKSSDESVDYRSDVTINMIGGTVEALIGSSSDTLADSVKGSVTINALGGTVTRRIIGGVYNENGWYSDSGKYITGDVSVVIGPKLQGMTDTQAGHGIFGGSRINTNPSAENARLIFWGGSYDTFKGHINADKIDCNSHHDYLITGTVGGTVAPEGSNRITVTPDEGYNAYIGGVSISESYTINSTRTDVVFTNDGPPPLIPAISALSGIAEVSGVQATITYTAAADINTLMLALYENEMLVAIVQPSVQAGIYSNQNISIPYAPKSGTSYTLKAFLWNNIGDMIPLCRAKDTEITVE